MQFYNHRISDILHIAVLKQDEAMCWETVYIRGKEGFQEVVLSRLNMTWLAGSTIGETNLLMFWLPKLDGLRAFKKTIGSKLIFKYRINFFTNLDFYLNSISSRSPGFSIHENEHLA